MTRRRALVWLLATPLVLVLAVALTLRWASRSDAVLRWGVEQLADRLPCRLDLRGMQGSITEPVRIELLRCESEALLIEAREVQLDWSPWALRDERLDVALLSVEDLRVVSRAAGSGPARPPEHLRVPLPIRLGRLALRRVELSQGDTAVVLRDVELSYDGDADGHRIRLASLALRDTTLAGEARVAAAHPFALEAVLKVSSSVVPDWPVKLEATLSGDLLRLQASFSGQARDLPLAGAATLAAFEPDPLPAFSLRLSALDLASIRPELPATALDVEATGRAVARERLEGSLTAVNNAPGTLDQRRLPVRAASARFSADARSIVLRALDADLGAAGGVRGEVTLGGAEVRASLAVHDLDLRGVHGRLRTTRLNGNAQVTHAGQTQRATLQLTQGLLTLEGDLTRRGEQLTVHRARLDAQGARLEAQGEIALTDALPFTARARLTRFDPARFGDFPAARLDGWVQAAGSVRPDWSAALRYRLERSRFRGRLLEGSGGLTLSAQRLSQAQVQLDLGRNRLRAHGAFGGPGDRLHWSLDAPELAALDQAWSGAVTAQGSLAGTLAAPSVEFEAQARELAYARHIRIARLTARAAMRAAADPAVELEAKAIGLSRAALALDSAQLTIDGSLARHAIALTGSSRELTLAARLDGGLDRARSRWSGWLRELAAAGSVVFELESPAQLALGRDEFALGAAKVRLAGGMLAIGDTRYQSGRLASSGEFSGMRLTSLLKLLEQELPLESSIVLKGRWDVRAGESVSGEAHIAREQGDIMVPGERPAPLGITALSLDLRAQDNRVSGALEARAGENGVLQARGGTRLQSRGGRWGLAGSAPVDLEATATVHSLRPLLAVLSRRATGDGRVDLRLSAAGTLREPRLRGVLEGADLRIEHLEYGVFLRDGVLRASLADGVVDLEEFIIQGGAGRFAARGKLSAAADRPQLRAAWRADKLTVVQHPDLRLTLSGQGTLSLENSVAALRGALTADQGRVELRADTAPRLGDDVVVAGSGNGEGPAPRALRTALDLTVDLGQDFTITGRGLDAALAGSVALAGTGAALSAKGRINTTRGTYEAYGQRLTIERGGLIFTGPLDDPGLDIRALRKNLQVEAGVEVSGTVRNPRVRLVSVPDVPDAEKVSWLVLGRRMDSSSASDMEKLQASAMTIAAGVGAAPVQQQIARAVGLDEVRYTTSGDTRGGAVAVGKRISDRIYLTFEQNLSEAGNKLWVSYQLTRRWSVRTESGKSDAVDLFYTWSFD